MSSHSLTYHEIANLFGMTTASARNLVRRKKWQRQPGNDGLARIMVPSDAVPIEPPVRDEGSIVPPSESHEGGIVPPSNGASLVALAALERHVARLETEVATLKGEIATLTSARDAERERAIAMVVSVAALEATRDALRDEISRRGWWPFRRRC